MNVADLIRPGRRAVVLGLGVSGRAAVRFLCRSGMSVAVSDSRPYSGLSKDEQRFLREQDVSFEGGEHSLEFLCDGDFLVISPGVPTDLPLLREVRAKGLPVVGELALAACYIREKVVAVTGTNGKTTVTSLIGNLLQDCGKKVFVGGNIGTPLLDYLCGDERVDVLVLELSSFQLESAGDFRPDIGILLNVTPDHLDRHGTMDAYAAAKMNLFQHQNPEDAAILCGDAPLCRTLLAGLDHQQVYLFGSSEDCQARSEGSQLVLDLQGRTKRYSLEGTPLDSATGRLNSGAALLAVSLLGGDPALMQGALQDFVPAAHRLQLVAQLDGVDYYDDSKATNSGAVLSALASFAGNVILIAGGRDKGDDYGLLAQAVKEKVKQLILIGEASPLIESALQGVSQCRHAASMEEAVGLAASLARPGDVVLLSPACASFDMFRSYGHRGEVFCQAVQRLAEKEEAA